MNKHNNHIQMSTQTRLFASIFCFIAALAVTPAYSATVSFSGTIVGILEDTGGGVYSGASSGDPFTGSFVYGNSALDASDTYTDPVDAYWFFSGGSYGGVITDGTTPTVGSDAEVGISNNWTLTADDTVFFTILAGSPVPVGTVVDMWSVFSLTSGAYFDATDTLYNGTQIGIGFVSLDGSLYSGLDYQALPPALSAVDGGFFYIEQADAAGNTQFLALGSLTGTTAVVPVPAAVWLFGSGLLGLIGVARRKRS